MSERLSMEEAKEEETIERKWVKIKRIIYGAMMKKKEKEGKGIRA